MIRRTRPEAGQDATQPENSSQDSDATRIIQAGSSPSSPPSLPQQDEDDATRLLRQPAAAEASAEEPKVENVDSDK